MRYKTAIFDLDGTLLNTLNDLTDSVNYAMKMSGFPEHTPEEVRTYIGNGVRILIKRSVPKGTPDNDYETAYRYFEKHYADNCHNTTVPYDGIMEMLKKLKEMNCDVAIVSNKIDFAVKSLRDEFFGDVIDVAIGDSEDTNNKPSPDMVYKALKELGAEKADAVYIGDTDVDLQTAENSGMDCISVSWGFRSHDELKGYGAKMIADTPMDVIKFIAD